MSRTRIVIFAKAPIPGRVKTRLIPALGEDGAARLARDMLLSTISEAVAAAVGKPELCTHPGPLQPVWGDLIPARIHVSAQGTGDLGQRLARAARRGLDEAGAVLLIGTDCPDLDRNRLRRLAAELQRVDALICPAEDGGYVALGLRRYHPSLFSEIAWSTESVARETIRRIERLGWSLHIGETLRDVDTPEDLEGMRLGSGIPTSEAAPILASTITCPTCGHRQEETMPTDACLFFYECPDCGMLLKPLPGHCCVFCSFGSIVCPPMQQPTANSCCGGSND